MGQDPEAIREQIEQTRDEMSGTVEALGQKADVKGRAKGAISDKKEALVSRVTGAGERVSDATPDGQQVAQGARQAVGVAYAGVAGMLALQGKSKVQEAGPPVPEQTVETVKEDVEWAKTQKQSVSR